MIAITERFEVPSSPTTVWAVLSDPNAVVQCLEGAELGEALGEGKYHARITVKFGALRIRFNGQVELELNDDTLEGRLIAQGKDARDGARFNATVGFTVAAAEGGGSVVVVQGDVQIAGKLMSVIEAGATKVVRRMTDSFAENLAAAVNARPIN